MRLSVAARQALGDVLHERENLRPREDEAARLFLLAVNSNFAVAIERRRVPNLVQDQRCSVDFQGALQEIPVFPLSSARMRRTAAAALATAPSMPIPNTSLTKDILFLWEISLLRSSTRRWCPTEQEAMT